MSNESFTLEEACSKVIQQGGILRLGGDYTVKDYINDLIENNVIFFNGYTHKYQPCDKEMRNINPEKEKISEGERYWLLKKVEL